MKTVKKVLAGTILAGSVLVSGAASAFWGPFDFGDWFDDDDWWDDYPPPWVLYGPYGYPGYGYYGYPAYGYGYPAYGAYPYGYGYPYGGYAYPGYSYPTTQPSAPASGTQKTR